MRKKLDPAEIEKALTDIPEWRRDGSSIVRSFKASSFRDAQARVNRLCDLAEGAQHHPDLQWTFDRITIALTTHDTGGLTALDFRMAALIDQVLASG